MSIEKATGIVSFSLFGISAALSSADARSWGQVLMELAPLILIAFLAISLWKTNKKHEECQKTNGLLNEKIILIYASLSSRDIRRNLPEPTDFNRNNFELNDLVPPNRLPEEV